jgi:ELWxxDGT repeat protein
VLLQGFAAPFALVLSLIGLPLTAAAEQIGSPFLVADLNQGPKPNPSSSPGSFAAIGSTLYFAARTAAAGAELWKSDGTDAGTVMVKDIRPGTGLVAGAPDERRRHAVLPRQRR